MPNAERTDYDNERRSIAYRERQPELAAKQPAQGIEEADYLHQASNREPDANHLGPPVERGFAAPFSQFGYRHPIVHTRTRLRILDGKSFRSYATFAPGRAPRCRGGPPAARGRAAPAAVCRHSMRDQNAHGSGCTLGGAPRVQMADGAWMLVPRANDRAQSPADLFERLEPPDIPRALERRGAVERTGDAEQIAQRANGQVGDKGPRSRALAEARERIVSAGGERRRHNRTLSTSMLPRPGRLRL